MRIYTGIKIDDNMNITKDCKFVSYGRMTDGTTCYHEVIDGEEIESTWYSCCFIYADKKHRVFILEGV
jgi:hypothetical protein